MGRGEEQRQVAPTPSSLPHPRSRMVRKRRPGEWGGGTAEAGGTHPCPHCPAPPPYYLTNLTVITGVHMSPCYLSCPLEPAVEVTRQT